MPQSAAPSEKIIETADEPNPEGVIQKPAGRLAESKTPAEAAAPAAEPTKRCS